MTTLAPAQFRKIASIALDRWGLDLQPKKFEMIAGRMAKFCRRAGFEDTSAFLSHLEDVDDESEWLVFFDILSTNVTSFFREKRHFDYLEREFYTPLARGNITLPGKKIRLWSAGCSAGQEPYSMAIQALELLPNFGRWDFKILATDLSNSALDEARTAIYSISQSEQLTPLLLQKYALRGKGAFSESLKLAPQVTSKVTIRQLNLMDPWHMKGTFNVIFCCNVMIYFNKATREQLVRRFYDQLMPGGIFGIGSAETLSGLITDFRSVQSSLYIK